MKITHDRKSRWAFYPGCVVSSIISIPIAWGVYWVLISQIKIAVGDTIQVGGQRRITEDFLLPYIFWPALGLVTGFLQYLLLRLKTRSTWLPYRVPRSRRMKND